MSVINSVQAYTSVAYAQLVYRGTNVPIGKEKPHTVVTPLSARTFGTWTLLSSVVRCYAAYNLSNPIIYQLAMWSFAIALAHFSAECLVFGTTKTGAISPLIVSSATLAWMLSAWDK